jgi:ZIP family zinc transporter
MLSLVWYERWLAARGQQAAFGPGAMAPGELTARRVGIGSWSPARRLALLIAVGIGLHNFGEGLAIGGSAATGAISLAVLLVIGFALHNATEGFGIVAPLAAEGERPSWTFLLLMGVIGGGPTFLGTVVGRQFTSDAVSMLFLTLAAGSILYVVIQLLGVAHKVGRKDLLYAGVLAGLTAGFVTDMVVTAAGA